MPAMKIIQGAAIPKQNQHKQPGKLPSAQQFQSIADTFSQTIPNLCFVVTTQNLTQSPFQGKKLLNYAGLVINALTKFLKPYVTDDELKQKCFIWVYDSRSNKNLTERRDQLKKRIGERFAGYNLLVALSDHGCSWQVRNAIAWCEFKREEYGHNILIVLT